MAEPPCPLARRFARLARRDPRRVALLGPDGAAVATRADIADQAEALATSLAQFVGRRPVVLSLGNSPELIVAFLALRRLSVPVALVDAVAPAEELGAAAATAGADAVLAPPERLPGAAVWTGDGFALATRTPEAVVLPDLTGALKMTSGSTGAPRAVAVSVRQLVADAAQLMRTMGFGADDVTLAAIPLTHSYGIGSCLIPLLLAGTPLAFPSCALPAAVAETLERARVAHFPAVPAMVRALASLPAPRRLPHLRVCLTAGAPLAPADAAAFAAAFGIKVHVFYGSSECGGITYDRSEAGIHGEGEVGQAIERVQVEVVDETTRSPVPTGAVGRVRVRSRAVALGVVPPSENRGAIEAGAFLAGDFGRFDAAGVLTLTGRVSDLLNVAGKKVHPDEVRRVLESIAGVATAAVIGLPDRHRGDLVAAVVVPAPGADVTVAALLHACRRRLAPHKVPRRIVLAADLPYSERGKLRRDELVRMLTRG